MEMEQFCSTDILEVRQDTSDDLRRIIDLVTSQPNIIPVGTFRYNIFKYPGDIDIFESLESCCEPSTAKITAAQKIQAIVNNISETKIIFVEFKAGYDLRFKIYTGSVNGHVEDYNPTLIRRDITNLYDSNLLTRDEYIDLIDLVKDEPTDVVMLNDALRNYWVLRWTKEEILQGYKVLRGNYKLFLDIALSQGTIVKLDAIAYVDDRFVEVTNFFLVSFLNKLGSRFIISQELSNYEESLLLDVYKYYSINPLKSIKRLWMYLAFKRKLCDAAIFTPLFSSNISLYSQILADRETALQLLSPKLCPDFIDAYGDYKVLFDSLSSRLSLMNGLCDMNLDLNQLKDCVRAHVNKMTYDWLKERNIDIFSLIEGLHVSPSSILDNEADS